MAEYRINGGRAQEVRNSTFGKQTREPIARSAEFMVEYTNKNLDHSKNRNLDRLEPIDAKCATRIANMSVTSVSAANGYYRMTFTRENGT